MIKSKKSAMIAALAALGMLVASADEAKAISVTLQVSGVDFDSTAPRIDTFNLGPAIAGMNITANDGSGAAALVFAANNLGFPFTVNEPTPLTLGTFSLGVAPQIFDSNSFTIPANTTSFSLDVTQINPAGGTQELNTTLSGTVSRQALIIGGAVSGSYTLAFAFNDTRFVLGGILYEILGLNANNALSLTPGTLADPGSTDLRVRIAAVPEPATMAVALSGLATLGLYGLRRSRRKGAPDVA